VDGRVPRLDEVIGLEVRVVLVGNGPARALPQFVRELRLGGRPLSVVTDPSLASFRAAGLLRPRLQGLRAAVDAARALSAGYAIGRREGDARQLGGAVLVDDAGRVAYHHRGRSPGDLLDA